MTSLQIIRRTSAEHQPRDGAKEATGDPGTVFIHYLTLLLRLKGKKDENKSREKRRMKKRREKIRVKKKKEREE